MKLYEIAVAIELSDEDKLQLAEEEIEATAVTVFHVASNSIADAIVIAEDYILDKLEDHNYDIIKVEDIVEINIVNFPGENNRIPFLQVAHAAPEDIIKFNCSCGHNIEVVDGWKEITCPKCLEIIPRDRIIGGSGKYIFLTIDKNNIINKGKFKKDVTKQEHI